ncbi:MAG: PaaI family thioesterase [Dehalococcoidia bacterium]
MRAWKGLPLALEKGYAMCFACGKENPIGLKLTFRREGDAVKAEFTPGEVHQGWPGVIHGGIIDTLLDEALGYVSFFLGLNCVTAKMEVRIRHPVSVGQQLFISSTLARKTRKLVETRATIALADGTPVAEGKAVMYIVNEA